MFTRTKHGANRLAEQLEKDGINSTAIHGNKSQGARTRALADFKSGAVQVLVATDIAARGLDIEQLPHVVNFELPHVSEDYVHRIGRTGRAGKEGKAISLVCVDELKLLRDIEQLLKKQYPGRLSKVLNLIRVSGLNPSGKAGEANNSVRRNLPQKAIPAAATDARPNLPIPVANRPAINVREEAAAHKWPAKSRSKPTAEKTGKTSLKRRARLPGVVEGLIQTRMSGCKQQFTGAILQAPYKDPGNHQRQPGRGAWSLGHCFAWSPGPAAATT